jgi:hypothetical protein
MAEIKITYSELMNKGAKATAPAKVVIVKNILTNLKIYIINSVNS